jgi:hypothetical protein
MLQALINLFTGKKKEEVITECPYKIESAPVEQPVQEKKEAKPAKITASKKPNVKAKTARNKKKNG